MITKEKMLLENYPYAYHWRGTDYIHPAFMFEQLSMEGETPRRARPLLALRARLAVLSACLQRHQPGLPGERLDSEAQGGGRFSL